MSAPQKSTTAMSTSSVAPFLQRTYAASHAYQHIREVIVNAMQAGATKVCCTTEWQGVKNLGIHRRIIIDNGPGIARDKIPAFINQFGGSGKTIGAMVENFGVGFKTSTLPWNKHGVIVISKTADGEVSMMWLHYDAKIKDFGARMFDIDNADGLLSDVIPLNEFNNHDEADIPEEDRGYIIDGVDWTKVFPADQESGLAVVYLGDTGTEHTIQGAPDRDENKKYGIVQYLNGRFWTCPVDVVVDQYENWNDVTLWPTGPDSKGGLVQGRVPKGLKSTIATNYTPTKVHPERGVEARGVLTIPAGASTPATKVEWILCDAPVDQRGDIVTLPISGVLHSAHKGITEVFDLASMGAEVEGVTAKKRMSNFVKASSVRDRLILIFTPTTTKGVTIFPDQSRTKVMWANQTSGGQSMPWDYWTEWWNMNTPTEIRKAISDHYASLLDNSADGITDEDYRRLGGQYGDMFRQIYSKVPLLSKRPKSSRRRVVDSATEKPDTIDKDKVTDLHKPPRHFNVGLVKVLSENLAEGEPLVSYDRHNTQAVLNTAHPRYITMSDIIVGRYIAEGKLDAADDNKRGLVEGEIVRASQMHLVLAISDAVAEAAAFPERTNEILTDEALSACMRGIRHIEQAAAGSIGHALSGNRKRARKAA